MLGLQPGCTCSAALPVRLLPAGTRSTVKIKCLHKHRCIQTSRCSCCCCLLVQQAPDLRDTPEHDAEPDWITSDLASQPVAQPNAKPAPSNKAATAVPRQAAAGGRGKEQAKGARVRQGHLPYPVSQP